MACLAASAVGSSSAYAAEVIFGEPRLTGGNVLVDVSVAMSANESLAGLQFDVTFDESAYALREVELGVAAAAADKDALFTDAFPGSTRVLVTGMNQNAIEDGVVATLVLEPLVQAGGEGIDFERPILSDPFGNQLYVERAKDSEPELDDFESDLTPELASTRNVETAEVGVDETIAAESPAETTGTGTALSDTASLSSTRAVDGREGIGGRGVGGSAAPVSGNGGSDISRDARGSARFAGRSTERRGVSIRRGSTGGSATPGTARRGATNRSSADTTTGRALPERFRVARAESSGMPEIVREKHESVARTATSEDSLSIVSLPHGEADLDSHAGLARLEAERDGAAGFIAGTGTFVLLMTMRSLLFGRMRGRYWLRGPMARGGS